MICDFYRCILVLIKQNENNCPTPEGCLRWRHLIAACMNTLPLDACSTVIRIFPRSASRCPARKFYACKRTRDQLHYYSYLRCQVPNVTTCRRQHSRQQSSHVGPTGTACNGQVTKTTGKIESGKVMCKQLHVGNIYICHASQNTLH